MNIHDKPRINWACRRGMLELDIIIIPFFKYEYDSLTDHDKHAFIVLLKNDDPDIFNWIMNYDNPGDFALKRIVKMIQQRNFECKYYNNYVKLNLLNK